MTRGTLAGIIGAALLLFTTSAHAANSNQAINIVGVMRDGAGALQSTPVTITVNLYGSPSAATPFFTQTFPTVVAENGFFTVELSGSALSFATVPDAWVGLLVAGDPAELPRQHLDAAPYAMSAVSADSLSSACSGCVTESMIAPTIQRTLSPSTCPAGSFLSGVAPDGTATCNGPTATSLSLSVAGVTPTAQGALAHVTTNVPGAGYLMATVSFVSEPVNNSMPCYSEAELAQTAKLPMGGDPSYTYVALPNTFSSLSTASSRILTFNVSTSAVFHVSAAGPQTIYLNVNSTCQQAGWDWVNFTTAFFPLTDQTATVAVH